MAALRKLNSERHGCHKERKKKGRKKGKGEKKGEGKKKRKGWEGFWWKKQKKETRERERDPGEKHRGGEKEGSVNS